MSNNKLLVRLPLCLLVMAALACSALPGGGSTSGLPATADGALTQAAAIAATAGAAGSSFQATADAASTQALATANAAGAGQPTAAATTAGGAGPQNIPLIDPHTVVTASDQELTYDTTADIQTVAKFYQDQMPKLGWTAQGQPYITDSLAKMSFNTTDKIATIGISVDPSSKQTVVSVLIE